MSEPVEFEAQDGFRLGGTLFRPAGPYERAVAIHAATGVRQDYYARFAAYLAGRGFAALVYDYRGIGRSRPRTLRGFAARMRDWALLDAPAALECLERAAGGARLMAVGHSFGGQALGLLPRPERIAAALVVGSQSGYWRHWPPLGRSWMWLATHVVLPAAPRLLGYFPSSTLGFGEDLPAGVATEWASWCRHPQYLVGALGAHEGYARFTAPLRAYAVSDDRFAPPRAVEALLKLYPSARTELRRVAPVDVGAAKIGHFGFFRERFRDTLWREAADWLAQH
jgi:predicted alpha/beta hydrolase